MFTCIALVVGLTRGGPIEDFAGLVKSWNRRNCRVEITEPYCRSSCVMFLGADHACIDRDTQFFIHGPSWNGRKMAPVDFNHWSQVIADHYPKHLGEWFMATGRFKRTWIPGEALIKMGVEEC